ncbi:phage tail fiber protein [Actinomadura miaoliensis]|uniref:Head decoration protein n=1 Tax=Actinomadura miaoliensis TaxID=430685 RepID=A0ABP7V562_9ACTN
MPLTNAAKNLMLDELGSVAVFASLHTADPGTTGAAEVSGGSPAYARKAITWNAAAGGNLDSSNAPVFDVPGGTTVTHFGLWSAASGGTFYSGGQLSANETFTAQGQYTLTDADVNLT